jgi:hypothetical protein
MIYIYYTIMSDYVTHGFNAEMWMCREQQFLYPLLTSQNLRKENSE